MPDEKLFPLHQAVLGSDEELTLKSLQQGSDPDILDEQGMAPLHWAIFRGDYDMVKILLENGANPDLRASNGETPLSYAEDDFGLTEITALLRQYGAVQKWQLPPATTDNNG